MTEHDTPNTITLAPEHRYHFVGIGGIGMSAIAQILLARGFRVSGSDAHASPLLTKLAQSGATVAVGHDAVHVQPGDILVRSDAIKPDNPEWQRAVLLGLPVVKRADLLGALVNSARGIAISGTHGKTTSSGMLATILLEAEMNPTCILGGELSLLGGNARPGGPLTLVEACEAYNSFLDLYPEAALVTNIEVDHLDFHGTPEHLFDSFRQFLRQVRVLAVLNGDDHRLRAMADIPPRAVLFGSAPGNTYRLVAPTLGAAPSCTLLYKDAEVGVLTLQVPGIHNLHNAVGAAVLALEMGASFNSVQRGLAAFPGMHRRFERLGACQAVAVIDDYAHHPTEIRATLAAARTAFPGRLVAVFQPHLFSRTRDLLDDFAAAFADADYVLVAPIYPARELPIPGVDHHLLVTRINALVPHPPARALSSLEDGVRRLTAAAHGATDDAEAFPLPALGAGDAIITLGAGDIDTIARTLVSNPERSRQC